MLEDPLRLRGLAATLGAAVAPRLRSGQGRVPVKICPGKHSRFFPLQQDRLLAQNTPTLDKGPGNHNGPLTEQPSKVGDVHLSPGDPF